MSETNTATEFIPEFFGQLRPGQLPALFDYLPETYFVIKDRAGRVVMANPLAIRLCGFTTLDEMVGKTDHNIFHKERADAYVQDDRQVFETGRTIVDRVEMAPSPDHAINWFVTTKVPLYSQDNEVIGLACIAQNMTSAYERLRPYSEMTPVIAYVEKHYARPIKIPDLAKLVHLSARQFERRFQQIFQITPKKHLLNVRIRAACHLLANTRHTVAVIAQECGFYDESHFSRGFKQIMGMNAGEYRKSGCRKRP